MSKAMQDILKIEEPLPSYLEQGELTAVTEKALKELIADKVKQDAFIVMWQNDALLFGRVVSADYIWAEPQKVDFAQFVELRVFNEQEELYISGSDWRYRAEAGAGEAVEYVDTYSRLWGTRDAAADSVNGFVRLHDAERKLTLVVPCVGSHEANYYELGVRSYIGYAEATGQAGYIDYRYLGIQEGRE